MRSEFAYHNLNQAGIDACTTVRERFSALLDEVETLLPQSRERSLVVTKLQEACKWAVSGIATRKENQVET